MPDFDGEHGIVLGVENDSVVYVQDDTGEWHAFNSYEYFNIQKGMNQISTFEIKIYDIQDAEKVYFKERANIMFFVDMKLVLKARIQTIEYSSAYECVAKGMGLEVELMDKEYVNATRSPTEPLRVQYDNVSAQTIYNELLSSNSDGVSPFIINPKGDGIFANDYGDISFRFENATRLQAIASLTDAINYNWWVSIDDYDYDVYYFNVADYKGSQTSVKTYAISGTDPNCEKTSMEKDISNLVNYVNFLGRGDGINQVKTSTYNASPIYSTLGANLEATDTSIQLSSSDDLADFPASGQVRIAEEVISYTGKGGVYLTGCTRDPTVAQRHVRGVYIEKYVVSTAPETSSSISTYGLMEHTIVDRTILDETTAELICSQYLLQRLEPVIRIKVIPAEPTVDVKLLEIGDLVTIIDAESNINSDYRIININYNNEYGNLSLELEVSNASLAFIDQMQKQREQNESLQKYMQGSTNVYVVNNSDNCDNGFGLKIKTYIPVETSAINHVNLSYDVEGYRTYSSTNSAESSHIHGIPSLSVSTVSSNNSEIYDNYGIANMGNLPTGYISFGTSLTVPTVRSGGTFARTTYLGTFFNWNTSEVKFLGFGTTNDGFEIYQTNGDSFSLGEGMSISYTQSTDRQGDDIYFTVTNEDGDEGLYAKDVATAEYITRATHTHSVTGQTTTSTTSNSGSAHTHGSTSSITSGSNTVTDMQIYINGTDRTSAIETDIGHTLSVNSTESEIELTQYINKGWNTIEIRPNGTCRISADMWNQVFIESK
jgi:hypothetical protein